MKTPTHALNPSQGLRIRSPYHLDLPILIPDSSRPAPALGLPGGSPAAPPQASASKTEPTSGWRHSLEKIGLRAAIALGGVGVGIFGHAGTLPPLPPVPPIATMMSPPGAANSPASAPSSAHELPAAPIPAHQNRPGAEVYQGVPFESGGIRIARSSGQVTIRQAPGSAFEMGQKLNFPHAIVIIVDADSITEGLVNTQPQNQIPDHDKIEVKAFIQTLWTDIVADLTDPGKMAEKIADDVSDEVLDIAHHSLDFLIASYVAVRIERRGREKKTPVLVATGEHLKKINDLYAAQIRKLLATQSAEHRERFPMLVTLDLADLPLAPIPLSTIAAACGISNEQAEAVLKAGFFIKHDNGWSLPHAVAPRCAVVATGGQLASLKFNP